MSVSLPELVEGARKYPLTADEFRKFLATQYCEENFEFLLDVKDYKGGKIPPKDKASLMVETYIKEGASKEINIRSDMRTSTLEKARAVIQGVEDVAPEASSVFDPPAAEVGSLIKSGGYLERFFEHAAMNISPKVAFQRKLIALALTLCMLALGLGLWLGGTNRYLRILTLPFSAGAVSFYLSGQKCF